MEGRHAVRWHKNRAVDEEFLAGRLLFVGLIAEHEIHMCTLPTAILAAGKLRPGGAKQGRPGPGLHADCALA